MAKTPEERKLEIEQQIRRLKKEKRRIENAEREAQRRKREHALIVAGAHLLTRFPPEVRRIIEESSDDEIRDWIDSLPFIGQRTE